MAEKRFRVLFMIFSESYFATAPFSRKRSEPSTASTLPASGCGERLVPHFDHLELRGPAFGIKAVALGTHGALLGAPLCGLGHIRVGHIRKGGCACGFGPACGVPHQHRAFCIASRDCNIAHTRNGKAQATVHSCIIGADQNNIRAVSTLKRPYFTFFFNKTCVKRPKTCVKNVLHRCARLCPLLQFVRKGCRIQSQSNTGELVKQAERKYLNFDPFT